MLKLNQRSDRLVACKIKIGMPFLIPCFWVYFSMFSHINNYQVFYAIIQFVSVFMVNVFSFCKLSLQTFFYYKAMFINLIKNSFCVTAMRTKPEFFKSIFRNINYFSTIFTSNFLFVCPHMNNYTGDKAKCQ